MTLAPTEVPTPGAEPDHVEVLIKEARRRGRHHLAIGLFVAALTGAAVLGLVVGIGGNGAVPRKVHDGHSVNPIATAADWATAPSHLRGQAAASCTKRRPEAASLRRLSHRRATRRQLADQDLSTRWPTNPNDDHTGWAAPLAL